MAQLKDSENDLVAKSSNYLRSESLHTSPSPTLQPQRIKAWAERKKPTFKAAHLKSEKAKQ